MQDIKGILFLIIGLNLILLYMNYPSSTKSSNNNHNDFIPKNTTTEIIQQKKPAELLDLKADRYKIRSVSGKKLTPFDILYYSRKSILEVTKQDGRHRFDRVTNSIIPDPNYCTKSDLYHLAYRDSIFKEVNFFASTYTPRSLVRKDVVPLVGNDFSSVDAKIRYKGKKRYRLDIGVNVYFTKRVNMHNYLRIGKEGFCTTQMYGHIPGRSVLGAKHKIIGSINDYAKKYIDRPHCFTNQSFHPLSYRLYDERECKEFFQIINSIEYQSKIIDEPIQYLIKIGFGAHRAKGVFLLDETNTKIYVDKYENGEKCGKISRSLFAQTYIGNPLLLDLNNKFDFRMYMLIASTNPMIVYYHDGFLRVSLNTYDKKSTDRHVHLTNTHLAKEIFHNVKHGGKIQGMTEQELRDYQMWTLPDLSAYLLENGKIDDPNWLDNYLRPQFKKAFIHFVRMSEYALSKESNIFEMYGLDFMLDDNLNLWFIECNSSPQLIGTNPEKKIFLITMLRDLFEIEFAYFRSRMKRVFNLIDRMGEVDEKNIERWRAEFDIANKNYLEPEYEIRADNTFHPIMDMNRKGFDAYFGILEPECVID